VRVDQGGPGLFRGLFFGWAQRELAAMGLFLASDEASYVNGQAIPVDGGLTASIPYAGKRFRFLLVMAGLDPAIHLLRKTLVTIDGYAGQARV